MLKADDRIQDFYFRKLELKNPEDGILRGFTQIY